VCVSVPRRICCTDPDASGRNGRACPLVVHYLADLQSVHGFCCYDDIARKAKCQRVLVLAVCLVTFRVSRRPREMYFGNPRLCVCLSATACRHYCTDPDATWRVVGDAPWLCTIGRICNRWTGCVAMETLWKCVAEPSGNPPGPPHAARTTHAGEDSHRRR